MPFELLSTFLCNFGSVHYQYLSEMSTSMKIVPKVHITEQQEK